MSKPAYTEGVRPADRDNYDPRSAPPDVAERSSPPDVAERSSPPDVAERSSPPDVAARSSPPDVAARSSPPDVAARSSPPDVAVARLAAKEHARSLPAGERTRHPGIPITKVARTLLDMTETASNALLHRAVAEALVQRRVDVPALEAQLARAPGRRAAPRLAALIEAGAAPTRSELEDRLLDLLVAAGLPRPKVNVCLRGLTHRIEVDFLFERERVVLDADGARFHEHRLAPHTVADRQEMLEAAGCHVLRMSWEQVTGRPDWTVRRVREALADRRPRPPAPDLSTERAGAGNAPH